MTSLAAQQSKMMQATARMIVRRDQTLPEIARGAQVPREWLRKLAYAPMQRPQLARLERLHDYLKAREAARRHARAEERERRRVQKIRKLVYVGNPAGV